MSKGTQPRWLAGAALAGTLALSACAAAGQRDGDGLVPRFASPAQASGHAGGDAPARVRRDAHGRAVYFREQRMNRHGAMRDVARGDADAEDGALQRHAGGADCDGRRRCRSGDDRDHGRREGEP